MRELEKPIVLTRRRAWDLFAIAVMGLFILALLGGLFGVTLILIEEPGLVHEMLPAIFVLTAFLAVAIWGTIDALRWRIEIYPDRIVERRALRDREVVFDSGLEVTMKRNQMVIVNRNGAIKMHRSLLNFDEAQARISTHYPPGEGAV